jgi:hypothetical protein
MLLLSFFIKIKNGMGQGDTSKEHYSGVDLCFIHAIIIAPFFVVVKKIKSSSDPDGYGASVSDNVLF